jgi:hypothetical protein
MLPAKRQRVVPEPPNAVDVGGIALRGCQQRMASTHRGPMLSHHLLSPRAEAGFSVHTSRCQAKLAELPVASFVFLPHVCAAFAPGLVVRSGFGLLLSLDRR